MRNFLTGRSEPKQDKNATVEQRMSVMIKNEDILEANQLWENIQYTEQSGEKVNWDGETVTDGPWLEKTVFTINDTPITA